MGKLLYIYSSWERQQCGWYQVAGFSPALQQNEPAWLLWPPGSVVIWINYHLWCTLLTQCPGLGQNKEVNNTRNPRCEGVGVAPD